ncbi:hypothetical protein Dimus_029738, partial [Dionaea muscipula]
MAAWPDRETLHARMNGVRHVRSWCWWRRDYRAWLVLAGVGRPYGLVLLVSGGHLGPKLAASLATWAGDRMSGSLGCPTISM